MRETKSLEFKESITNTFLKTVSAYANYGTGKIQFGIKDDGAIIGIENPREACLMILLSQFLILDWRLMIVRML